ncbi:LytTR family DNA-binding domain-containing protein [Cytophagaceae bacterium YF14B1]|uniref:LytTR family DNA-binding domain-containing protein n=1 Tax=Xanthocytophaga flava TaxID=3048013 RepID=A0AAE3QUR7_9BACT|nr:LytTR family DNA-binding domain-containing protein [Xanthocytophaga flavus]MDJ1485847.1 LytTR family DNA-binding domain-containing protein [Xanthocytophaga flavus]
MKYKCLLVDDEPLALRLLENHLQHLDQFDVYGTCKNAIKAYEFLQKNKVDLLFLDIKMPQLTGIEFLKTLSNPPKTILTTAYRDFAFEGYELGIVDYLLKPILFDRFLKAIDRFIAMQVAETKPKPFRNPEDSLFLLKSGNKNYRLPVGNIVYIESIREHIKLVLTNGEDLLIKYKISELEAEIGNLPLIRTHRSFIVNMDKIVAFSNSEIELGKKIIPIGLSYREVVKKALSVGEL